MTTAGGTHARRGRTPADMGGLVVFATVMLILLAFFNALDGIAAINRSRVFIDNAVYVVGDLRAWGWTILGVAIAQAVAALGLLAGAEWARWLGVLLLALNALAQMFFIPSFPLWSLLIIALDIVAIYGLTAAGRRVDEPPGR